MKSALILIAAALLSIAVGWCVDRTAAPFRPASPASGPAAAQSASPVATFHQMYADELRAAFFAAFLSLGGFLLALQTFIVVKMKETVYDHPAYIDDVIKMRQVSGKATHYGPLSRLSNLLTAATLSCFVCAVLQFTLGFFTVRLAVPVCIASAVFTVLLLLVSLLMTWLNLRDMFRFIEEESEKKHTPDDEPKPD